MLDTATSRLMSLNVSGCDGEGDSGHPAPIFVEPSYTPPPIAKFKGQRDQPHDVPDFIDDVYRWFMRSSRLYIMFIMEHLEDDALQWYRTSPQQAEGIAIATEATRTRLNHRLRIYSPSVQPTICSSSFARNFNRQTSAMPTRPNSFISPRERVPLASIRRISGGSHTISQPLKP